MRLKLLSKKDEVYNVISFYFESDTPLSFKAGQYMRYHLDDPKPDERRIDRYFTIAAAPFEKNPMLTTRFDPNGGSTFKKDLKSLNIGDSIEAVGPMGAFVIEEPNLSYVFIAGGIGITPYRSILLQLDFEKMPINVTLFYANRNQDIIFKEVLDQVASRNLNLKIHYVIDPEKITEDLIKKNVSDLLMPFYFLSGPQPMVQAFVPMLTKMGVSRDKIKTDFFPGYVSI